MTQEEVRRAYPALSERLREHKPQQEACMLLSMAQ